MNELITELAEHANYLATEKEFPYDEDWFYLYNRIYAELIVKECVGVADHSNVTGKSIIGQRIKEHFGVE